MAEKPYDPAAAWQTFLGEMERGFNSFANQAMGSSEFSRAMNQMSGASMGAQKALGEAMERYLVTMNLPSREQVTSVGERLGAIEAQLADIRARLGRLQPEAAAENPRAGIRRPPRTRRPPPPKEAAPK